MCALIPGKQPFIPTHLLCIALLTSQHVVSLELSIHLLPLHPIMTLWSTGRDKSTNDAMGAYQRQTQTISKYWGGAQLGTW